MLTLTEQATNVIRTIADRPDLPETAGLRIASTSDGQQRLTAEPAGGPESGDAVVEDGGARVFLESEAAAMLNDQVLDAVVGDAGEVQFVLGQQPPQQQP